MRKAVLSAAVLLLCLCLSGCGGMPEQQKNTRTRVFTDDLGRRVSLPETVEKTAVTGPMAQIYVYTLCPDKLVGFSAAFSDEAERYIPQKYLLLPELGQLYGGKGTVNTESLLSAAPDVVVDIGQSKSGQKEELDRLSALTGIPFVHINADVSSSAEVYRTLGEVLCCRDAAEQRAAMCEEARQKSLSAVNAAGERKRVLYCLGPEGTNVLARGSYHAQVIDMLAENAAAVEAPVSGGDGNTADMEQILLWDPDVILFSHGSIFDRVKDDPVWQSLRAVKNGQVYEVPGGPYGWISSPPASQCFLGMLWLADVLYPEQTDYDLYTEVSGFYRVFFGYSMTEDEFKAMTGR